MNSKNSNNVNARNIFNDVYDLSKRRSKRTKYTNTLKPSIVVKALIKGVIYCSCICLNCLNMLTILIMQKAQKNNSVPLNFL